MRVWADRDSCVVMLIPPRPSQKRNQRTKVKPRAAISRKSRATADRRVETPRWEPQTFAPKSRP